MKTNVELSANEENVEYLKSIRTYNIKFLAKCLNCGKPLKEIKDPITKQKTGHLFTCKCMPNIGISIG